MTSPGRPLPRPTELSAPFWDGCRDGKLRVQQCRRCQTLTFVPRPVCPGCQGTDLGWLDSAGTGSVYSHTTVHRAPSPAFAAPYVVAIIEMDEGWHLLSNIVGPDAGDVSIGDRVQVDFVAESDDVTLPVFRRV